MPNDTLYLVTLLHDSMPVMLGGNAVPLDLCWHDGMIGCLPVFNDYEVALAYAKGDASKVLTLEVKEPLPSKPVPMLKLLH